MNNGIPLIEFAQDKTQQELAELLGCTQGGARKMLISGRDIRVIKSNDGSIKAFEVREVPARK
ncbi:hypothetical protein KC887_07590 [Candidatus Kaiserbacteria bacterium]|nr:hypothetical protein [Candidatus Kaiserbacteria bacterium]